jgi:membrane protease subunit HflC
MKLRTSLITGIALVLIVLIYNSLYIVDETEQVVITRWGRIIGDPVTTPGLKTKLPWIDRTNRFPKNLLHWDGDPGQIPTSEKTYIWVDTFARWKITDPVKFLQTAVDTYNAIGRLNEILDPAVRNFITSHRLLEAVRTTNTSLGPINVGAIPALPAVSIDPDKPLPKSSDVTYGRDKIIDGILKQAQPKLDKFGIELVDVQIKRINYVDTVRNSVYNRMIAERNQIAEKIRSEGRGEARKIMGQKERELKKIMSEAYKTSQELKGKADGKATRIYAEAFGQDPEFYSFIRTLELYGDALDKNSSLVMSTDAEFLKYLKSYSVAPAAEE